MKKVIFNSTLLLVGLLMGPFSTYLFIEVLNIPLVVPELVFIPFFFLFYKKYGISLDSKVSFYGVFAFWLLFLAIAMLWGLWDIIAILSTGRSFLVMGIFYAVGKHIRFDDSLAKVILLCSIGSIIGWVIKSYFNLQNLVFLDTHEESVVYGNMIAIAFAFAIAFNMRSDYITVALVFAINVFLSFTSALRRQMSVSVLSLFLSLGMVFLRNRRINYLILIIIISIPVFWALPQIERHVMDLSSNLHYRVFERSNLIFEGDIGYSEQKRINSQFIIIEDFQDLIVPHGYVSQHTSKDAGTGIFNDAPIYMLAYSFGVITLLVYLFYYIIRLRVMLIRFIRQGDSYYGVIFVVATVILFLHFIDSQMFTVSYTAPFTGLTLGLMFRRTLLNSTSNSKL